MEKVLLNLLYSKNFNNLKYNCLLLIGSIQLYFILNKLKQMKAPNVYLYVPDLIDEGEN